MGTLFRILLVVNVFTLSVSFVHLSDPSVSNLARMGVAFSVPQILLCCTAIWLLRGSRR